MIFHISYIYTNNHSTYNRHGYILDFNSISKMRFNLKEARLSVHFLNYDKTIKQIRIEKA